MRHQAHAFTQTYSTKGLHCVTNREMYYFMSYKAELRQVISIDTESLNNNFAKKPMVSCSI